MTGPIVARDVLDRSRRGDLRRRLIASNHPVVRVARRLRVMEQSFYLPLPRPLLKPYRSIYLGVRRALYAVYGALVCQPLFRAACTSVGRGLRVVPRLQWIHGPGRLVVGDDVTIGGKCSFDFAHRFSDAPTLTICSRTTIGEDCRFVVAERVFIGEDCLLADRVHILDSNGHPVEPDRRLAREPQDATEIKPVHIGNNVWIGTGAIILPGVTIGDGAVVSAHSVVVNNVAPYTLVAGYPARKIQEFVSSRSRVGRDIAADNGSTAPATRRLQAPL